MPWMYCWVGVKYVNSTILIIPPPYEKRKTLQNNLGISKF